MVEFFSQSFSIQIDECNLSFAFKCLIIRWKSICQHLHSFETPLTFKCFLIYSLLILFFKKNTEMKKTQKRLRKNIHSKHIYSKNIWILFLIECETTPLPWFIATYSQLIVPIIFHILQNCKCEAFLMTLIT